MLTTDFPAGCTEIIELHCVTHYLRQIEVLKMCEQPVQQESRVLLNRLAHDFWSTGCESTLSIVVEQSTWQTPSCFIKEVAIVVQWGFRSKQLTYCKLCHVSKWFKYFLFYEKKFLVYITITAARLSLFVFMPILDYLSSVVISISRFYCSFH